MKQAINKMQKLDSFDRMWDLDILSYNQAYTLLRYHRKVALKDGNHNKSVALYHKKRDLKLQNADRKGETYITYYGLYSDVDTFSNGDYSWDIENMLSLDLAIETARHIALGALSNSSDVESNISDKTRITDANILKKHHMSPIREHFSKKDLVATLMRINYGAKLLINYFNKTPNLSDGLKSINSVFHNNELNDQYWTTADKAIEKAKTQYNQYSQDIKDYTKLNNYWNTLAKHNKDLADDKKCDFDDSIDSFKYKIGFAQMKDKRIKKLLNKLSNYPSNALIVNNKLAKPIDVYLDFTRSEMDIGTQEARADNLVDKLKKKDKTVKD